MDPRTRMRNILSSPGWAAANQAASNFTNFQQGRPAVNPMQAYHQVVQQKAELQNRQQLMELRRQQEERQQAQFEIESDPGYDYKQLVAQNLIDPTETTYSDWVRMGKQFSDATSQQKNLSTWMALNPNASPEETQRAFNTMLRPYLPVDLGGGGTAMVPQIGQQEATPVVTPEAATAANVAEAEQIASAKSWGTYDAEFGQTIPSSISGMQRTIDFVKGLRDDIAASVERGEDVTGFIEGRWTPYVNRAVAYLDTISTLLTVPALAEAKLNPVTEQEFQSIKSTFANALRDPEANLGALQAQLDWLEPRLQALIRQYEYYQKHGTMRGYEAVMRAEDVDTSLPPAPGSDDEELTLE